ncbi:MAG: DUF4199 domain-containing protein [Balneolaceae bacterium]|nr:MAG: DUF4199 domain-containing protein [Balneolaceae bacterium]
MNEHDTAQEHKFSIASYWPSIVIVGAIFGLVSFVAGLFFGYQQINSEPTGSFFSPATISSGIICLITAFAGMVTVWHYTKEVSPFLKLGQGAALGFLTGAVITVISLVLSELWVLLFDPEYNQKILESIIANIEAMDMPSSTRDDLIDTMADSMDQSALRQLFWGIPVTGLFNLITALIGVAIFAEKKEDEL